MKNKSIKKIWVNPVDRISVQGRHKQTYTVVTNIGAMPTVTMRKSKEFGTAEEYQFPYNHMQHRLETGMSRNIDNFMLKDQDPVEVMKEYKLTHDWRNIVEDLVKQDQIKEQTWLEIKHGVQPNFYTDQVTNVMTALPSNMKEWGSNKTYLQGLKLILYPRPNEFSTETPRQELLMKMVEVLPQIANSKAEANSAYHNWYISAENEAEIEKAKKADLIEQATYNLYKLKHESGPYRTYQVAIVAKDVNSREIAKGELKTEVVNNILNQFILTSGKNQMRNIEEFMKLVNMQNSVDGIERFEILYLFQQALNVNIIGKRDNTYIWHSKGGNPDVYDLGSNSNKIIDFFLKEYKQYNQDSDITNYYSDLRKEVSARGVWFDE